MTITSDTVEHVAKLARLELTAEEIERYTRDLANILTLVEQLNELDLAEINLDLDVGQAPALRPDHAVREFSRDALMANAPEVEDGYFRVPKILSE